MLSRQNTNALRHKAAADFRRKVWEKYDITPYAHQADWILAGEGWTLTDQIAADGQVSQWVMLPNRHVEPRLIIPRGGGAAHILTDLAGFKAGKSFSLSMWACGYAAVDGAGLDFIGLEYDTSAPEFEYLSEFLLSERGMNLKPASYRNNKREGAIWIELDNGARFDVKSYRSSRKSETMKGKTKDCYVLTEAYQLPGMHVFTRVSQNLRQRDGHVAIATTPDRAWVTELHDKAHGRDPYWHCICDVDASCNPATYDQAARDRDDPDRGGMMTRERFDVAWRGKVKRHIGAVYDFDKDANLCSPLSFPRLWNDEAQRMALEAVA